MKNKRFEVIALLATQLQEDAQKLNQPFAGYIEV
jgi:hypothetical protein